MNPLSALRATTPSLASVQALQPEAATALRGLRPGDLRELNPALTPPTTTVAPLRPGDSSFSSLLGRMVSEVSNKASVAAQQVAAVQSGKSVSLHQAMISMEEASVSFSLMAEVRNKLLESYQELMRMQV